ncbi:peptidoglycan-binding protein LysM [Fretibacter rubidus]|uniref:peptidoglycan-binding protein LysM n=1 Tax=Fretibacter rubidus TaxID=570162 RepID=UPI00352B6642
MFGMIPFVKMAGRGLGKIFKGKDAEDALKKEVKDLGLAKDEIDIHVDDNGKVSVKGKGVTQEMKEKIILAVGNVEGVGEVEDGIEASDDAPASEFHTVVSGDTLWAISKRYYNKGSRYKEIFEANRPMLKHPDKIYVGQVLRIPADNAESV